MPGGNLYKTFFIQRRAIESRSSFFYYTLPLSLANFVGIVFGILNVLEIRLWCLLLAAALSFESETVFIHPSIIKPLCL
jgi:hypothetical protein